MAQTIATIALIISIIVLQHLYNWAVRKLLDLDEFDAAALFILATSTVMFLINIFLFRLLLEINK